MGSVLDKVTHSLNTFLIGRSVFRYDKRALQRRNLGISGAAAGVTSLFFCKWRKHFNSRTLSRYESNLSHIAIALIKKN